MKRHTSPQLSAADLVVLSLLSEEPMHGYRIVSELDRRDAQDWAPVSRPQVYYSIKKLAKLGFITTAVTDHESLGPEREEYVITAKGLGAMTDALSQLSWALHRPPPPFTTWMALSSRLSADKTLEIIRARREFLMRELQKERKTLQEFDRDEGAMVVAGRLMVSLAIELFEVELEWLDKVREELPGVRRKNFS